MRRFVFCSFLTDADWSTQVVKNSRAKTAGSYDISNLIIFRCFGKGNVITFVRIWNLQHSPLSNKNKNSQEFTFYLHLFLFHLFNSLESTSGERGDKSLQ